jgi:uridine kinase
VGRLLAQPNTLEKLMNWKAMAIDGPGGSGKSTLAKQLAEDLGAEIISMDAFLLPVTNYRLSAIAKNYDLDRFGFEVIDPLVLGEPIKYQVANLETGVMKAVKVPAGKPVIIDGIYSFEVRYREAYDFSIFIHANRETLLHRGMNQGGSGSWLDKWLVGEETYLEAQSPMSAATLIVDGSLPTPTTDQIMEMLSLRLSQQAS